MSSGEIKEIKHAPLHGLKTIQPYFDAVWSGEKNFELRLNDRDFHPGDYLHLEEYVNGKYADRSILAKVISMAFCPKPEQLPVTDERIMVIPKGWGLEEGYCIMGIEVRDRAPRVK